MPTASAECQVGALVADWNDALTNFEGVIGKNIALIKCNSRIDQDFPFRAVAGVYHRRIESPITPYLDLHPSTNATSDPILADIAAGLHDDRLQAWAVAARDFGKPVWLCFDGEMNGNWHCGSGEANGGGTLDGYGDPTRPDGPEVFIDAWRHVHDVFVSNGARNVAWVWAVNHAGWPDAYWNTYTNYYPGDAYVDWMGVHGYNWTNEAIGGWKSFEQIFTNAFNALRGISTNKPIVLGEMACSHRDGDKSDWIRDTFEKLRTQYTYVRSFIWFNLNKEENWTIDSDGAAAPLEALSNGYFVSRGDPGTAALNADVYTNLALRRYTCASSIESASLAASNAVDGDYLTRWSSAHSDDQWIQLDLGMTCETTRVILNWETAFGQAYEIQTSLDSSTWANVYSTTNGDGAVDDIRLPVSEARYVRMHGSKRGTAWGFSLYEFEVYTHDTDRDRLPDTWEVERLGDLAGGAGDDPDGEGYLNGEEYVAQTDPGSAGDALTLDAACVSNGQVALVFTGRCATAAWYMGKTRHYAVESSGDLAGGTWTNLPGAGDLTNSGAVVISPDTGPLTGYFRLRAWLQAP